MAYLLFDFGSVFPYLAANAATPVATLIKGGVVPQPDDVAGDFWLMKGLAYVIFIGALLPRPIAGYNIAKKADCTFDVRDGFVRTKDLEALTTSFRIVSKGEIDFIKDDIDFDAEVTVRGLIGIVFLPISKVLTYRGTGTVSETKWSPKILGGARSNAAPPPPAAGEEPKKRRSLFGN